MDLRDLFGAKATIENVISGPDGGPGLTISYNPNAITPAAMSQFRKFEATDEHEKAICEMLVMFELEWDLTSEGKPVPTTVAGMQGVPVKALARIMEAIQKDATPKAQTSDA